VKQLFAQAEQDRPSPTCEGAQLKGFETQTWFPSTYRPGDRKNQFAAHRHVFTIDCSTYQLAIRPVRQGLQ
jgi:hypothetical protein